MRESVGVFGLWVCVVSRCGVRGCLWGFAGTIQAPCKYYTSTILVPYRYHTCTIQAPYKHYTGTIQVPYRRRTGTIHKA